MSDRVCAEHGLSIITPKPYRERQKRTVFLKKRTQRDELCEAIDAEYRQVKKEQQEYLIAKQTVEHILGIDHQKQVEEKKQEKEEQR